MIEEINNKPVYTIHELLEGKKLAPSGSSSSEVLPRPWHRDWARSWDARW